MKFLIDTNILIPLEPTSPSNAEATTEQAIRLVRLVAENGHQIYLHPASLTDLSRDENTDRRDLRTQLLQKYPQLPHPPDVSNEVEAVVGKPLVGSNEYVDNLLLTALRADAIDWLVTHDIRLHKKAKRLGLSERTLGVLDAIQVVEDLAAKPSRPVPVVESTVAHSLDAGGPILESLRQDYPGFELWLAKCKREHRQTWLVPGDAAGVAALCIVNPETAPPEPLRGKVLKLCSFKVSERFQGLKYGELLLKTVFEYACTNHSDWIYATVFEKHADLLDLLRDCGFRELPSKTELGELVLAKPMRSDLEELVQLDDLECHIRYGPHCFRLAEGRTYLVPIQPRFAHLLFPESATQPDLFHGQHPFGSAIRKAYLCHASIRTIEPGCVLAFYRSEQQQGIIAIGVVERAVVSKSSEEIARLVARRTVYSLATIREFCANEVLVLLFRQALVLDPPISEEDAKKGGVFTRAPQSIMTIRKEGLEWLREKLST